MYREKMQKRIEEAVMDLYETMYRIAITFAGNKEDAVTIVQDSIYKAIQNTNQVKNERYIETWLYKIVIYTAMEFQGKNQQEIPFEELFHVCVKGREYDFQDVDVNRVLDELSEREKAVIILHFFEDKEIEEIAVILNANISTVKSLLYRSLNKMGIGMMGGKLQYGG